MTPAENVLLQGYAVTGALAAEQALITQGYAAAPVDTTGRIVVNLTGGPTASTLTGGVVED